MKRCTDCGRGVKTTDPRCAECRKGHAQIAFLGTWERKGLVWKPRDHDTDLANEEHALMARMGHNLRTRMYVIERPTCDQCGCLLKHADETCPGCLAWAERDAVLASWRRPIDTERSVA